MKLLGDLCIGFGIAAILMGCVINPGFLIFGVGFLVVGSIFLIVYNTSPQAKEDWQAMIAKEKAAHEDAVRRRDEKRALKEYHRQCREARK